MAKRRKRMRKRHAETKKLIKVLEEQRILIGSVIESLKDLVRNYEAEEALITAKAAVKATEEEVVAPIVP